MLPLAFEERMKRLLGDEYGAFIDSFARPDVRGMRVNTLKATPSLAEEIGLSTKRIDYTPDGYILDSDVQIGKSAAHHSGAIYMQDPGAMAPVCSVDIPEGARVIDLCSAPGGKSGQAAARIGEGGFILSNEYVPKRAKITVQNIERLGIKCGVVTNLDTAEIKKMFSSYFDVVIADVPCSGEGMFRKNDEAISEWSEENVKLCAERGREILENAADLPSEGGVIVYSTCTWAPEENEEVVADFLRCHDEYELIPAREEIVEATSPGINIGEFDLSLTRRFYPHKSEGEGQYLAILRRKYADKKPTTLYKGQEKPVDKRDLEVIKAFFMDTAPDIDAAMCRRVGENIVLISHGVPIPPKNVFSSGVLVGEISKGVLTPSHQLFSAWGDRFLRKINLTEEDPRLERYLRGEEIENLEGIGRGWCVITYRGATLGGGKAVGDRIKNHYPKGLRNH